MGLVLSLLSPSPPPLRPPPFIPPPPLTPSLHVVLQDWPGARPHPQSRQGPSCGRKNGACILATAHQFQASNPHSHLTNRPLIAPIPNFDTSLVHRQLIIGSSPFPLLPPSPRFPPSPLRMHERTHARTHAQFYGHQPVAHTLEKPKKIKVIISPVAGKRESQKTYDKDVRPVFHLAGVDVEVERTARDWAARDITRQLGVCCGSWRNLARCRSRGPACFARSTVYLAQPSALCNHLSCATICLAQPSVLRNHLPCATICLRGCLPCAALIGRLAATAQPAQPRHITSCLYRHQGLRCAGPYWRWRTAAGCKRCTRGLCPILLEAFRRALSTLAPYNVLYGMCCQVANPPPPPASPLWYPRTLSRASRFIIVALILLHFVCPFCISRSVGSPLRPRGLLGFFRLLPAC